MRIGTDEANRIYALAAERGLTEAQVDTLAHDMRLMMGTIGIDGLSRRSARQLVAALPAARRPQLTQPQVRQCTPKQPQYVADLLARRARTGEGGGFEAVDHLYTADGNLDLEAIDALSAEAASRIITSLKGDY